MFLIIWYICSYTVVGIGDQRNWCAKQLLVGQKKLFHDGAVNSLGRHVVFGCQLSKPRQCDGLSPPIPMTSLLHLAHKIQVPDKLCWTLAVDVARQSTTLNRTAIQVLGFGQQLVRPTGIEVVVYCALTFTDVNSFRFPREQPLEDLSSSLHGRQTVPRRQRLTVNCPMTLGPAPG